jgi:hypothetical protein
METAAMAQSLHNLVLQRLVCMVRALMALLWHPQVLNQPVYMAAVLPLAAHTLNGLFFK